MGSSPFPADGPVLEQQHSDTGEATRLPSKQTIMNQNILQELQARLESDPECDILSIIPASYKSTMTKEPAHSSATACLNQRTIDELQSLVSESPEIDLLSDFQKRYRTAYDRLLNDSIYQNQAISMPPKAPDPPPKDTLSRLASAVTATVIFPVSSVVDDMISRHVSSAEDSLLPSEKLALSMKRLFDASDKLWENPFRGAVFKCNDEVVAKVISGTRDTTEYTSLQYLQAHVPEVPAPRPHGLVRLGYYWAIFMTYVPSTTLEKAWPSLFHEQKVSIQHQLDGILIRMREMKQADGLPLGGVGGEGVKDLLGQEYRSDGAIETIAGFEDFKFAISKFASESYIRFLKALLPPTTEQSVFTHGDLRPANIMVQKDEHNDFVVKGIIDWEDSGFYPDFHEATKCNNLLDACKNTDWYQYLPKCISPPSFPQWCLVDRLLNINIRLGQ